MNALDKLKKAHKLIREARKDIGCLQPFDYPLRDFIREVEEYQKSKNKE